MMIVAQLKEVKILGPLPPEPRYWGKNEEENATQHMTSLRQKNYPKGKSKMPLKSRE